MEAELPEVTAQIADTGAHQDLRRSRPEAIPGARWSLNRATRRPQAGWPTAIWMSRRNPFYRTAFSRPHE